LDCFAIPRYSRISFGIAGRIFQGIHHAASDFSDLDMVVSASLSLVVQPKAMSDYEILLTYEAILRIEWSDHIPNCPNCSRAQESYWENIFAGRTGTTKEREQ
jgi:hypothetical protein